MNDLLEGLHYGQALGFWVAGIAIGVAWLSRGISVTSIAGAFFLFIWPLAPIAIGLHHQSEAKEALAVFSTLCYSKATERVIEHREQVSQIFVDGGRDKKTVQFLDSFAIGQDRPTILPGYQEVHRVRRNNRNDSASFVIVRLRPYGSERKPQTSQPLNEELARYGVTLEMNASEENAYISPFYLRAVDRKTGLVLGEQQNYLYRSPTIVALGYPLWREQERFCPLSHPADFVFSVLTPTTQAGA